jgi:hypothetical protein
MVEYKESLTSAFLTSQNIQEFIFGVWAAQIRLPYSQVLNKSYSSLDISSMDLSMIFFFLTKDCISRIVSLFVFISYQNMPDREVHPAYTYPYPPYIYI